MRGNQPGVSVVTMSLGGAGDEKKSVRRRATLRRRAVMHRFCVRRPPPATARRTSVLAGSLPPMCSPLGARPSIWGPDGNYVSEQALAERGAGGISKYEPLPCVSAHRRAGASATTAPHRTISFNADPSIGVMILRHQPRSPARHKSKREGGTQHRRNPWPRGCWQSADQGRAPARRAAFGWRRRGAAGPVFRPSVRLSRHHCQWQTASPAGPGYDPGDGGAAARS